MKNEEDTLRNLCCVVESQNKILIFERIKKSEIKSYTFFYLACGLFLAGIMEYVK